MSEPKLISPMLDNFAMGDPISDHGGVRCCPAMEKTTEDKYIVKIISVPPTQTQLEALLLSGAYSDKESALSYFKAVADEIVEEAEILQKLSRLEGFVSYEKLQTVPMEEKNGFDVYLLGTYKHSLQTYFRHKPLTYLGAVNLGLDLCSALAVCRRCGYLYADLKPENIYITGENEYRIGDLGFIKLDSLKYASLPDRYRSKYTAPEIADAFSALNTTIDIYAVGLILYQAFNDSILPTASDAEQNGAFPPPAYADYEMAEIILKACDPDPAARWQDPVEMGQALVNYMQRNSVNDTPIIPIVVEDTQCNGDEETTVADETDPEIETSVEADTVTQDDDATVESQGDEAGGELQDDVQPDAEVSSKDTQEAFYSEDDDGNMTFLSDTLFDEPDPDQDPADINYEEVTDEVSNILIQADELIAHPAPDPVISPEPIDVHLPPPLPIEDEEKTTSDEEEPTAEEDCPESAEIDEDTSDPEEHDEDTDSDESPVHTKKAHAGRWLWGTVLTIIAVALCVIGFMVYKNYYLQPIKSIILDEISNGSITVHVTSDTDESKLIVICSDTYGNQLRSPVENGVATFTGLAPNSAYTVKVEINGFHRLTGDTSAAFTTPVQTNIVQFQAVTGAEDGSAILSFTIDGPDSDMWSIHYLADGEEEKSTSFAGHMATLTGLTVGKEYTFTLSPEKALEISGTSQIKHTATTIATAEDLIITGCINNTLTAIWSAPENITVDSWTVRCYSENGFDKTVVVTETSVAFEGIDLSTDYTVEVTAAGMSVNQRAYAKANAITVTEFLADNSNPDKIVLTWKTNGEYAQKNWVLLYTVDGSVAQELECKDNTATVTKVIPGANYTFTLQPADGSPVLGNVHKHKTPDAEEFSGYGVKASNMTFKMCKRPSKNKWDRFDLKKSDYTTSFEVDQKASFVIQLKKSYTKSSKKIAILFVIRDANGNIVNSSTATQVWKNMWTNKYCELDIPETPTNPGEYTISVYFNGGLANMQNFTIK